MICTSCGETITGAYMGDADSESVYCRKCILLGLKAARLARDTPGHGSTHGTPAEVRQAEDLGDV